MSANSGFSGSLYVFLIQNAVHSDEQEKESIILVRVGIEKSVPRDHRLSLLCKPCDAKR